MKGRRTLSEAAAMIERRHSSGQTVHEFCAAENMNVATYYYWHQRLRSKGSEETSILVPISFEKSTRPVEGSGDNLELIFPNGVRVSIPRNSELNLIRELIRIF